MGIMIELKNTIGVAVSKNPRAGGKTYVASQTQTEAISNAKLYMDGATESRFIDGSTLENVKRERVISSASIGSAAASKTEKERAISSASIGGATASKIEMERVISSASIGGVAASKT